MKSTTKTIIWVLLIILIGISFGNYFRNSNGNGNNDSNGNQAVIKDGYQEVKFYTQGASYYPNPIILKKGIPARLIGDNNRIQGCAHAVLIPGLNIEKTIRAGDNIIEFTPDKIGEFKMTCIMGMYNGRILVVE